MIVEISDKLRLEKTDPRNWDLQEQITVGESTSGRGRKPREENIGQVRWRVLGHYTDPASALRSLLRRFPEKIGVESCKDLREFVARIELASERLQDILKGIPEDG